MIRITIELLPATGGPPRVIGRAEVSNIGAVADRSDYHATVTHEGKTSTTFVRGHRHARSVWSLLHVVLERLKFHMIMER